MTRTDTVGRLEDALVDLGATLERTTADAATDRIDAALETPAIGSPLPLDDVSLPASVATDPTPADLEGARTGVTPARFAVAAYGTLAIDSRPAGDEPISLYPERHVAVVADGDVVPDLGAGFDRLRDGFDRGRDSLVLATGRSATADMGELVHGVHGPRDVHVVVVTDR